MGVDADTEKRRDGGGGKPHRDRDAETERVTDCT